MRSSVFLLLALAFTACTDKSPPTWPADGVLEIETTANSATVAWPAAADDTAVTQVIVRLGDSVIAELGGDATEYEATELRGEMALQFAVIAVDEVGNRSEPLEGSAMTADGTAPRWPAGAVLEHIDGVFRWSAASDTTGVTEYVLTQGEEELTRSPNGMFAFEGDPAGAAVIAYDAAGNESRPLTWRDGETVQELADVIEEALPAIVENPTLARPLPARLGSAVQRLRRQERLVPGLNRNRIKNEQIESLTQMRSIR